MDCWECEVHTVKPSRKRVFENALFSSFLKADFRQSGRSLPVSGLKGLFCVFYGNQCYFASFTGGRWFFAYLRETSVVFWRPNLCIFGIFFHFCAKCCFGKNAAPPRYTAFKRVTFVAPRRLLYEGILYFFWDSF